MSKIDYLFEYSIQQNCYHLNDYDEARGEFHHKPCSNGWYPLVLVTPEMINDKRFEKFQDKMHELLRHKPTWGEARAKAREYLQALGLPIVTKIERESRK